MLDAIKRFFDQNLAAPPRTPADPGHRLRLATAALLLEMSRQDESVSPEERAAIEAALSGHFDLAPGEARELMGLAEAEAAGASGYFQFTSLINDHFPMAEKIRIVELLWRIAAADAQLHHYEEHMVRKVAELLYVPHGDYIAAKLRAVEKR